MGLCVGGKVGDRSLCKKEQPPSQAARVDDDADDDADDVEVDAVGGFGGFSTALGSKLTPFVDADGPEKPTFQSPKPVCTLVCAPV